MARIYISSTFKDLEQERRFARDAILTLEHLPRCMENYTAAEERPIEACLKDVRSCQGYVGIFAWRYGFVHPAENKSVAHLEYEEAGRRGLPRLIFVLKDDATWPPEKRDGDPRIVKLRGELLLDRTCKLFCTPEELRAEVIAAVSREFGSGRLIPELLPYLCDCSTQEFELDDALNARAPDRPLFAVVHGDEYQCHDKYFERLRDVTLPKLLKLGQESRLIPYLLQWPSGCADAQLVQKRLRILLAEVVCNRRAAVVAEIQQTLAKDPAPAVIHTHLLTSDFQVAGPAVFNACVDFFRQWPGLEVGQQLIVLVFLKYEKRLSLAPERRLPFEELNAELRRLLGLGYPFPEGVCGAVLTELSDVKRSDVESWARSCVPPTFCDGEALYPDIRQLYEDWEKERASSGIPMENLAAALRELLHGYNSHRVVV